MYSYNQVRRTHRVSDTWWAIIFTDHITFRLVYLLANYLPWIKPNHVTFISIILGVASAYFFFLGEYTYIVIAAVLFEFAFILDSVDGKLARLTNQESKFGLLLDKIRDKTVHLVCLLGIIAGQTVVKNTDIFLTAGLFYIVLSAMNNIAAFFYMKRRESALAPSLNRLHWISSSSPFEKLKPIHLFGRKAYKIPSNVEWTTILFFLAPLLNKIELGFYIANALIVFSLLFLLRELYRMQKMRI